MSDAGGLQRRRYNRLRDDSGWGRGTVRAGVRHYILPVTAGPLIVTSAGDSQLSLTYCKGVVLSAILNPSPLSPLILKKYK